MRKKLVVGNWKLHGSLKENEKLLHEIAIKLNGLNDIDCGVCLPYPYLFQAQQLLANTSILWGSQNVSQFTDGAYTSSVSASMIADFGCSLAIIGHSERRSYSHESNQKALARIKRAVDVGITPIYCVGETLAEYGLNHTQKIIEAQILAIFDLDAISFARLKIAGLVIAYEPVWAIGTGRAATPKQAQTVHHFIRALIAQHDTDLAEKVRIIYGGSLVPENAYSLLRMPDIDGGLIGRCALNVLAFQAICEAAARKHTLCDAVGCD